MENKKVYSLKAAIILIIFFSSLYSCIDDAEWYELNDLDAKYDTILNNYINEQAGVFVVNEGNFQYDNASLSYYTIDSMMVLNDVFLRSNNVPLGDVAQSMQIRDSLGYVVVNNSGKIYIININTFELVDKITGFTSPREIYFIDHKKAYVSDLYAASIAIVDLEKREISGYIDVKVSGSRLYQHSTEQMIRVGDRLFVNCWSYDNTILVIDLLEDRVVDSVKVRQQPNSMVRDHFDRLWILCDGGFKGSPAKSEDPSLMMMDPYTLKVLKEYRFEGPDQPANLIINGARDTLYYLNRHVYMHPVAAMEAPLQYLASPYPEGQPGGYYSLSIDPHSSDLYIADAIDQVQRGVIYRYDATLTVIDTFKVGINPGAFCFKEQ